MAAGGILGGGEQEASSKVDTNSPRRSKDKREVFVSAWTFKAYLGIVADCA
jgi:hypothetical protein